MLKDLYISTSRTSLVVEWRKPRFLPYWYIVSYNLIQQSDGLVYGWTKTSLNENSTKFSVRDISPGTLCKWELKAIYNSATLDSGISRITPIECSEAGE